MGCQECFCYGRCLHDVKRGQNPSLTYMAMTARAADFAFV